jgi:hypothetical protein
MEADSGEDGVEVIEELNKEGNGAEFAKGEAKTGVAFTGVEKPSVMELVLAVGSNGLFGAGAVEETADSSLGSTGAGTSGTWRE